MVLIRAKALVVLLLARVDRALDPAVAMWLPRPVLMD